MANASINWCFTVNNYTSTDEQLFQDLNVRFIIYGRETGDNGTPHLQGFLQLEKKKRFTGMKKIHPKAHWEPMRSTVHDCITYCSKQDQSPFRKGEPIIKGQRTDIASFVDAIEESPRTQKELIKTFPHVMARYPQFAHTVQKTFHPRINKAKYPPRWPLQEFCSYVKPLVFIGAPGIGKTQYAKAHFEKPLLISGLDELRDYNSEEHDGIIFDDIDLDRLPRHIQIHLTDYEDDRGINVKYGTVIIPAGTKKIFTLNQYPLQDDAIERRIVRVNCDHFLCI